MLNQILSQEIISSLSYPSISTQIQAGGDIHLHLNADTKIIIHGMKHLQKGKTFFFVQVLKDKGNDLSKSRSFYIDQVNPASIKTKLKFLNNF